MGARKKYEAAMRRLVASIRETASSFLAANIAAQELEADGGGSDDAFDHRVLDETRAAFRPVLARCEGALQMLGIDVVPLPGVLRALGVMVRGR